MLQNCEVTVKLAKLIEIGGKKHSVLKSTCPSVFSGIKMNCLKSGNNVPIVNRTMKQAVAGTVE
jgi:hypothetical protein